MFEDTNDGIKYIFWLEESQKAINCVFWNQILEISHRQGSCHIDTCCDVTPFPPVNPSISYQYNAHYQENLHLPIFNE